MRHALPASLALAALAGSVSAQSITTLYNRNNGGSNGGAVYFDIAVAGNPLEITRLDMNTSESGIAFDMDIYIREGTSVGFESSIVGWTRVATASGTAAGANNPTAMTFNNSFTLNANSTYGIAFDILGTSVGHDYSGTGTNPSPGVLQYSNSDITLNLGSALNVEFSGTPFRPRVWNGTIYYTIAGCYPDCDTSTGPGVLDIFDFLCFQNRYDAGAAYACDCDTTTGPGVCDIFDFLCFQDAFAAGCP